MCVYKTTKRKEEEKRVKRDRREITKINFLSFSSLVPVQTWKNSYVQNKIMENLFDITSARKFHFLSIFYVCFIHNFIFAFLHPMEKVFPPFFSPFSFCSFTHLLFSVQQQKKVNLKTTKKKTFWQKFFNQNNTFFPPCFVWLSCSLLKVAKVVKKRSIKVTNNKTKQTKQNYKK